jgi:Glycosyl transferase family 2
MEANRARTSGSSGAPQADEPGASGANELLEVPNGPFEISARAVAARPVKLSLVIPTFNERDNVGPLVRRLTELLEGPLAGAYELIVVDDDSPDGTWEVARGLMAEHPGLRASRTTRAQRPRARSTARAALPLARVARALRGTRPAIRRARAARRHRRFPLRSPA